MASTEHMLDERMLDDLLAGRLDPATARRLADHLDGECERCEALLAQRAAVDPVDGRVDRALASLAPVADAERGNDIEFARILRAARGGAARPAARFARYGGLAIAATLALAVGVKLFAPEVFSGSSRLVKRPGVDAGWDGMKGRAPRAIPVKLRFAVARGEGTAAEVERGASGMQVDAAASLAFQVEVGGPAEVVLLRIGPDGAGEVLFRQRVTAAKAFDISVNGRPAAFPLTGVTGRQRFAVLASAAELPNDVLASVQREVGAAGTRALGSDRLVDLGVSADVVEVVVR